MQLSRRFGNQLIQRGFLEHGDAQNLQEIIERDRQCELLLDDRRQDINRYGYPDLCLHGVFGCPVKCLDPKILLDPSEEQFDLPAEFIEQGNRQSGKREVIRQERQITVIVPVIESDAPKAFGVRLLSVEPGEDDRLITG